MSIILRTAFSKTGRVQINFKRLAVVSILSISRTSKKDNTYVCLLPENRSKWPQSAVSVNLGILRSLPQNAIPNVPLLGANHQAYWNLIFFSMAIAPRVHCTPSKATKLEQDKLP